jgi:hypothetical protein
MRGLIAKVFLGVLPVLNGTPAFFNNHPGIGAS